MKEVEGGDATVPSKGLYLVQICRGVVNMCRARRGGGGGEEREGTEGFIRCRFASQVVPCRWRFWRVYKGESTAYCSMRS